MLKYADIVYLGIRLDAESKKALLKRTLQEVDVNNFDKFYCDHITLEYGEEVTFDTCRRIGESHYIKIGESIICDYGVAVLPVFVKGFEHTHITCATTPMTNPVKSKLYLQEKPYEGKYVKSSLKGTLVAYMKDGTIVNHL